MLFLHIFSSYDKILGEQIFMHGRFLVVGEKQKTERILQGLRVAQAAVTERWP